MIVIDEVSKRTRTNSYESTHLLDENLKVDTLLALNLVQAPKNRKVAEQTDVLARSTCGNRGDAWPSFGVAGIVDLSNESRGCGMLDTPDLASFIVDPIDYVRWEKARCPGWVLVAEVLPSLILFVGSFVPLAPMVLESGIVHGKVIDRLNPVMSKREMGDLQRSPEQGSIQEAHRWTMRLHVLHGGRGDHQGL